jgi:hypothetical protein
MRAASNGWAKREFLCRWPRAGHKARTTSTSGHGLAPLFLFSEPLTGGREGRGTERRTRIEWASARREWSDGHDPAAEPITVVLDHGNTHGPASF